MRLFILCLIALIVSEQAGALNWASGSSEHATGNYVSFAERKARDKAIASVNYLQTFCEKYEGKATYSTKREYCLLESPGFPAECVVSAFVNCKIDKEYKPTAEPSFLGGLYYSEEDQVFFVLNDDMSFETNLVSSFRSGQKMVLPEKIKKIGNTKFQTQGTITVDGRCRTTIPIELEKLDDGSLVIKETSPHGLNWSFGCHWGDTFPTYYNLQPIEFSPNS